MTERRFDLYGNEVGGSRCFEVKAVKYTWHFDVSPRILANHISEILILFYFSLMSIVLEFWEGMRAETIITHLPLRVMTVCKLYTPLCPNIKTSNSLALIIILKKYILLKLLFFYFINEMMEYEKLMKW